MAFTFGTVPGHLEKLISSEFYRCTNINILQSRKSGCVTVDVGRNKLIYLHNYGKGCHFYHVKF